MSADCPNCRWYANPDRPPETFVMLRMEWDVDRAKRAAAGREVVRANTANLAQAVDYPQENGKFDLFKVQVDPGHLDNVDPAEPVLIGQAAMAGGPVQAFVLDGHHRIARAVRDGLPVVPCRVLTEAETDACYIGHPSARPGRKTRPRTNRKARPR